jgi:hypothetical protein
MPASGTVGTDRAVTWVRGNYRNPVLLVNPSDNPQTCPTLGRAGRDAALVVDVVVLSR